MERTTRITITCAVDPVADAAADPGGANGATWKRFQYAALAESAVIPVREQQVQTYFVSQLPRRLTNARFDDHETYGKLLSSYLIPEDFRKLIEAGDPLTLVLDSSPALYPWEMAGYKGYRGTAFFGIDLRVARQFRTILSAAPGIAPALDHRLRVLLIADPAPNLPCPGARREAEAILDSLVRAGALWHKQGRDLDLKVTLRVGPPGGPAADLDRFRGYPVLTGEGPQPCEPVDLLALLLNEHYDIVHYAGHGIFDPKSQRMGWVFDQKECILSAAEIFCVQRVPRLVFANACWSSGIGSTADAQDHDQPIDWHTRARHLQVGLAEAFFARGVQNYLGAGWPVHDDAAAAFAQRFYERILGIPASGALGKRDYPRPATLGEAIADSRLHLRRHARKEDWGTSWGAYQHYGQSAARVLTLPEESEDTPDCC